MNKTPISPHLQSAILEVTIEDIAEELLEAYETKFPVVPVRHRAPEMTITDAYRIQNSQLKHHLETGRALAGWKIGLTSIAMQKQLGVSSPDFGFFLKDMIYNHGDRINTSHFISPKVEPEFAFLLKAPLQGPGVTIEEAAQAIDEIYPAMEIIDSRIANWDIKLVDTIADNASCGAIAIGQTPLDLSVSDLEDTTCKLLIDGHVVEEGTGQAVMGNPIAPLAWLANVLGEQGVGLKTGQLILPGSFTKAMPVVYNSSATADFGDLGSLTIHFT